MIPNTSVRPPQAPLVFTKLPATFLNDAKGLIQQSRMVEDQIIREVKPGKATFENVLLPLAHAHNLLDSKLLVAIPEIKAEAAEVKQLIGDFLIEGSMREDLYQLVDEVMQTSTKDDLDSESYLWLVRQHKQYVRNGMRIKSLSQRNRFKEIQRHLNRLVTEFQKNDNEAGGEIWVTPEELKGMPDDVLSGLDHGTGENEGKLRLPLQMSIISSTAQYVENSETRRRTLIARSNNCNENVPIFREIMILRDEAARILGYPNHASYRLEEKMAKNTDNVNAFLDDLRIRLTQAELEHRGEADAFDSRFYLWDNSYYQRKMVQEQYEVDQHEIEEYYPLQTTVKSMLKIFENLFGLDVVEITKDQRDTLIGSGSEGDLVWDSEVQFFSVWDDREAGGQFLGYLYLDLLPRHNKRPGISCYCVQPGFTKEDGGRQYPSTALVCSSPKPTPFKPSLLRHLDIVSLFHELGGVIHDLVSKTRFARFHGTMTVIDFGEAPNQMLEHWCWTPSVLKSMSHHYTTLSPDYLESWRQAHNTDGSKSQPPPPSEQIPDEMIDNLIRARYVNGAFFQLTLLPLSIYDMMIHSPATHEAIENFPYSAEWNKLRKEITHLDGPEVFGQGWEWGHGQSRFRHVTNDYDAGYYGYLYSQVFADDMFHSAFKADPMDAKHGRRYRYTVLEKGGSQDEMKTLMAFLGRKPTPDAFYRELGIA